MTTFGVLAASLWLLASPLALADTTATLDLADNRFDSHPVAFAPDTAADSQPDVAVAIQRHWFFTVFNHGPGTVGSASINATSARTFSTSPPPPFTAGPGPLAPGDVLRTSPESEAAYATDVAAPGFASARAVSPLVIPTGGGSQTMTATFTIDNPAYGGRSMLLLLDGNLPGAVWTFVSSSDPANTQASAPGGEVGVVIAGLAVGTTYTVSFTGVIPNTTGQALAYKPRLLFQTGFDTPLANIDASSFSVNDPVLQGTWSSTFDTNYTLHAGMRSAFGVDYAGGTAVASPTNADECKNGGWEGFGGIFKNQGDCVSFVATHGKNPPG